VATPRAGGPVKVAVPWRELGRTGLTPELLQDRLEVYLEALL
jgi:hypothetical protein